MKRPKGQNGPGSTLEPSCPRTGALCKRSLRICFCRVVIVTRDQKQDIPSKVARLRCGSVRFEFPTIAAARSSNQAEGFRCTHLPSCPVRTPIVVRARNWYSRIPTGESLLPSRYFFDIDIRRCSLSFRYPPDWSRLSTHFPRLREPLAEEATLRKSSGRLSACDPECRAKIATRFVMTTLNMNRKYFGAYDSSNRSNRLIRQIQTHLTGIMK